MNDELDINIVWQRIIENQGQLFYQIRGQEFTYTVTGNTIHLSTTNQNISRAIIARALDFVPLNNTVPIQHLCAPSYLYAILMDNRIKNGLW